MNVDVLIDSVVRQTTVLIAQLATAAGVRAPLAHVANQVFVDLTKELRQQGVGHKVIADMFGMALRSYHAKVQRLSQSGTYSERSLWEAMLQYIQERGTLLRADALRRFSGDDPQAVRAVLRDLVDSGFVFQSRQGDATLYRAATAEEYTLSDPDQQREGLVSLVWVALNRFGPASAASLAESIPLEQGLVQGALEELAKSERARKLDGDPPSYECLSCVIPLESSAGWEAAVFDHFQAMVTAICTKLRVGTTVASAKDWVGGSTYGLEVWEGHPHREEVLGFLGRARAEAVALRKKVEDYNAEHGPADEGAPDRVLIYVGQTVLGLEPNGEVE